MLEFTRRAFLAGGVAAAGASLSPGAARAGGRSYALTAAPARADLTGPGYPETPVWAYNGRVPGPEIRLRQGERLTVVVKNGLDEGTSVHWHGIRLPNAMDGVPYLTQDPIAPGETFRYEFTLPDAGTYWYHPHIWSDVQVGRGLSGPLIVEERAPIRVDRDLLWVLDDWRLQADASIRDDFGSPRDLSHNGRLGNTATVNGAIPKRFAVRAGERLRLRLVNVANARVFGLRFAGHAPQVVALDGQPVAPHAPEGGMVVLAPAQRADLVIDMEGKPGERFEVTDEYYRRQAYMLVAIVYSSDPPLRDSPLDAPIRLPANPLPEPDLAQAKRHEVVLEGGAMGGMKGAMMGGRHMGIRALAQAARFWAMNGVASATRPGPPILTLEKGRTHVLAMRNDTAWEHPMHLHGHSFRVIRRGSRPSPRREWLDTVLIAPRETVEVAFVADNPGDWMYHCHVLEHQIAGMMATVRVA